MSLSGSRYAKTSDSVPFYSMVLHGSTKDIIIEMPDSIITDLGFMGMVYQEMAGSDYLKTVEGNEMTDHKSTQISE